VQKIYLAVVHGLPRDPIWSCDLPLSPDARKEGQMTVNLQEGKPAQTHFHLVQSGSATALVAAQPVTGRTHQIRVHLAAAGYPIVGDALYSGCLRRRDRPAETKEQAASNSEGRGDPVQKTRQRVPALALRAVVLSYPDPFERRTVRIRAPYEDFVQAHGFEPEQVARSLDGHAVAS
jgi:23S rRNA-/tRNA-specific pseudouridylate synthase